MTEDAATAGDEMVVHVREAEPEPEAPKPIRSHFGTAPKYCCPNCHYEVIVHRHVTKAIARRDVQDHMTRCVR